MALRHCHFNVGPLSVGPLSVGPLGVGPLGEQPLGACKVCEARLLRTLDLMQALRALFTGLLRAGLVRAYRAGLV